jgi:hypothetical protein
MQEATDQITGKLMFTYLKRKCLLIKLTFIMMIRWIFMHICPMRHRAVNLVSEHSSSPNKTKIVSVWRIKPLENTQWCRHHHHTTSLAFKGHKVGKFVDKIRKRPVVAHLRADITLHEHIPVFADVSVSLNYRCTVKPLSFIFSLR